MKFLVRSAAGHKATTGDSSGGGLVGGMKLSFFPLGSTAGTSSGSVSSSHQKRCLERQRLEAQAMLEERESFLAEVQREQEKRLLEMKQDVAIRQPE